MDSGSSATSLFNFNYDSPHLPTRTELLLLSLYPLTLLTGSLFSHLSSSTRNVPYNAHTQSHPSNLAPSYFAQKRNVFNLYFVKIGWFWVTFALVLFVATHPALGKPLRLVPVARRRVQAAARWGVATLWWAVVTQWFFGPSLIDRGFRITGGKCELPSSTGLRGSSHTTTRLRGPNELATATACKAMGGMWKGGLDVSGHVFILILGSGLLWMEVLPNVLWKVRGITGHRVVRDMEGEVKRVAEDVDAAARHSGDDSSDGEDTDDMVRIRTSVRTNKKHDGAFPATNEDETTEEAVASFGVKVALAIAGLSWWMLLMTAAFFHTWHEKFTGLVVAFTALYTIYFLPRAVPQWRAVVGMPAV